MFSNIIKTLILLAVLAGLFLGAIAGVAWYQARAGKIGEPDRANFKEMGLPGADKPAGGGAGAKTRSTAAKSEKKASGKDITAPTTPSSKTPDSTEKPNKEGAAKSEPEKSSPPEKTEPAKNESKKNDAGAGSQTKAPDKQ